MSNVQWKAEAKTVTLAVAAAALMAGAPAQAAPVFSTGFEGPAYATGQLAGQSGWFNATNAFVQTSPVESGAQAVSAAPGPTGQHVTFHGVSYDSAGNSDELVTISTDFRLTLGSGVVWEGISATGNGGFINQILILGDTGRLCGLTCTGPILAADTWYNLAMEINYATGTVRDFVNGVEFSSGLQSMIPARSTTLSFIGLGINNTFASGATGLASWDNISVVSSTSAAPEPATWAMMLAGFGLLGGLARRRRTWIHA